MSGSAGSSVAAPGATSLATWETPPGLSAVLSGMAGPEAGRGGPGPRDGAVRALLVTRVVSPPTAAARYLHLDLGKVARVEDVEEERAQVEGLHRGLEARLRGVQHEGHLRIAVGLREGVEGMHLLPRRGSPGLVQEVAPLHEAVDGVQGQTGHAGHGVERLPRDRPCVAIAQEPLEPGGRLEADGLDVEIEVTVGFRERGRLAPEIAI